MTVALDSSAAGTPIAPATLFHGRHTKLWAFVTVPNVHPGDMIRYLWRDQDHHRIVEDLREPVQVNAALYHTRMYAFVGASATQPFPAGHYEVDVYRNATLVAVGRFEITAG